MKRLRQRPADPMPWHLPPKVRHRPVTLEVLQQSWQQPPSELNYKECWVRIIQLYECRLESGQRALGNDQLRDLTAYCLAWPTFEKAPELLTDKLRETLMAYWPVAELEPVVF